MRHSGRQNTKRSIFKFVRHAGDLVTIPRKEGAGTCRALARLTMDNKRNPWNLRKQRAKACMGEVVSVSYMSAREFGGLPDIKREGVTIPTQ